MNVLWNAAVGVNGHFKQGSINGHVMYRWSFLQLTELGQQEQDLYTMEADVCHGLQLPDNQR